MTLVFIRTLGLISGKIGHKNARGKGGVKQHGDFSCPFYLCSVQICMG